MTENNKIKGRLLPDNTHTKIIFWPDTGHPVKLMNFSIKKFPHILIQPEKN